MAEPEDAPQEPSPPTQTGPKYKVKAAQASGISAKPPISPSAKTPKKTTAVFVAHGMGQQLPFQTLHDIAEGLLAEENWSAPKAGLVEIEVPGSTQRERLQRIELVHYDSQGDESHVHVYEAYWAPLTEGRVSLRDVMGFLFGAGWNGLQKGRRTFQRWLLGEPRDFEVPVRVVLYLVVALMVIASLVGMNSTLLLISAARAPFREPAQWLTPSLFADLSTTLNLFLVPVVFFAFFLIASILERKFRKSHRGGRPMRVLQALSLIGFVAVLFAVVLAGVAMLVLLYQHVKISAAMKEHTSDTPEIWKQVLGNARVEVFNQRVETGLLWLLAVAAVSLLLYWVGKTAWLGFRDLVTKKGADRIYTLVAGTVTLLLIGAAGTLAYFLVSIASLSTWLVDNNGTTIRTLRRGVSWPILIGMSLYVRSVLVQYLGDVAVYVTSYRLDRFQELRQEIRDVVFKVGRAIYAWTKDNVRYNEVVVVGHSLGSAIVYDALNRLVSEDILAKDRDDEKGYLNVAERTPLLVTFGSPLDKFAFLFALQSDSPGRQAIAATLQPLLQESYDYRPANWVNIHSGWDIISGDLDFYDPPGSFYRPQGTTLMANSKHVRNCKDPEASTLLVSHVEYWRNSLLRNILRLQVTTGNIEAALKSAE